MRCVQDSSARSTAKASVDFPAALNPVIPTVSALCPSKRALGPRHLTVVPDDRAHAKRLRASLSLGEKGWTDRFAVSSVRIGEPKGEG